MALVLTGPLAPALWPQVDPRKGDQIVRGAVVLPFGTGRSSRVCVFALGRDAEIAREEGEVQGIIIIIIIINRRSGITSHTSHGHKTGTRRYRVSGPGYV